MQRTLIILGVAAAAVILILANAFYIVPVDQQALVLRFGEFQYTVNSDTSERKAGLHMKMPIVENVIFYDKRNMGFDLQADEIIAADQQRLNVDAIARWRIADPITFFRGATNMQGGRDRMQPRFNAALRGELGKVSQPDIISGQRASVMQRIKTALQAQVTSLGIEIIDVRIRRADLPAANSERVHERMKSQLQQKVNQYRAEGQGLFQSITGEADKQVEVIIAEANQKSQVLRGEGDSERNKIYASAYNRDPEFFSFYRSLEAYDKAIKEGTPFVMSPDSDFFRYFNNLNGR